MTKHTDDALVRVHGGDGRDADARWLDDVDGVDADARTDVARRRGVVHWHGGRDDEWIAALRATPHRGQGFDASTSLLERTIGRWSRRRRPSRRGHEAARETPRLVCGTANVLGRRRRKR